jgi:hypothetical protein
MAKNKVEEIIDVAKETGIAFPLQPYSLSAYNLEATTIKKQPLILGQKGYCAPNNQCVDVSGGSSTSTNGRKTWRLSDVMCLPQYESYYELGGPVSFVATPMGDKPIFLTTTVTIQSSPKDLVVEVYTWDKQGNPAPCVPFCWRCRLAYPIIVI